MIELDNHKYLDGGISDSIPFEKCKELGYDKIIVVLTRPGDYRKTKGNKIIPYLKYHKYPNLVKTLNNRYKDYNESLDRLKIKEEEREVFVIRPSKKINIKRVEKNTDKLQEMYDLGVSDCQNIINDLKNYINN